MTWAKITLWANIEADSLEEREEEAQRIFDDIFYEDDMIRTGEWEFVEEYAGPTFSTPAPAPAETWLTRAFTEFEAEEV